MRSYVLLLLFFDFLLPGCVGPTSPFGALNQVKTQIELVESEKKSFQVRFHPDRQVYHDKTDFSVEIQSAEFIPDDIQLRVYHNEFDVTDSFLKNAITHRSTDGKTWIYVIKDLRLKTLNRNNIRIEILQDNQVVHHRGYRTPECSLFQKRKLAHLGRFKVDKHYVDLIEDVAENSNPSFLAGIVAQESSFNPKAVSWAKAIGLTQITPLAEKQLLQEVKSWPRYPGINGLSYLTLKSKIYLGEIDQNKEWRLDPEMSLRGGMAYIEYLQDYWGRSENRQLLSALTGEPDQILTEVILASYNSGAARVKKAIRQKTNQWKQHKSLREAVKYLKKVSSYCYHYAKREV